jgi:L-rhamnose-H+ transport protein
VAVLGFGWGLGGVTMGFGVNTIGMGIAYATVMGINTVVGSVIPMIRQWSTLPIAVKLWTFTGIAICVGGVIVCSWAGYLREKGKRAGEEVEFAHKEKKTGLFLLGLTSCILSGFLSACANIGYDLGQPIKHIMDQMGTDPRVATLSAWMPMWWGGYAAMLLVFGITMVKRKTFGNFRGAGAGRDLLLAILVMGGCHFVAQSVYGVGAYYIGDKLGRTVGWAVSIAASLIVANILGFFTGEWRGIKGSSKTVLFYGLGILIVSMVCLAYANSLV